MSLARPDVGDRLGALAGGRHGGVARPVVVTLSPAAWIQLVTVRHEPEVRQSWMTPTAHQKVKVIK
jgi:hypothetical protein